MKKTMALAMLVLVMVLGACLSAQAGYRTEVNVTPYTEPHQFLVKFKIIQIGKDGKSNVLITPKIVVKSGQEGQIKVGEEKEESGVFCTALVKETDTGVEATINVTVKEKGSEMLNSSQSMTMKK